MQSSRNIWNLTWATFVEGIRHKSLWAIVSLAALLSFLNIAITELFSWDLGKVSVEFGLSAFAFTGILMVLFLALKILADDFDARSIHMILSRPVTIWQYTAGKFLGLSLILLAAGAIMGVSAAASMQFVFTNHVTYIPPNFSWVTYLMALFCQWLALLMLLSVSFFFFCFASNHFVALLFTVSTYLVGQNMELLRRVIDNNPLAAPLSDYSFIVTIISWIFPNLSLFDKKTVAAYGLFFGFHEFFLLVLYSLSYSFLLLYFSHLFLSKKDLT
ncbi:hypothetical protein DGMP_16980 [Desulfomarina profundi]|uniref:ABC transporter permease n=1 Tax=Desulfomarina profundi TaxID=2772557 RepID=A0A8D5FNR8_9BACT|nr:ABC transporter permease [Desulfomarina profundi]BCL61005.1 hypothetical protein DGMP_16980 [Desulfomarina profundi]